MVRRTSRGRWYKVREVVIVDAVRTPTGKRNGALSGLRPDDTLGKLIYHLITERLGIDPSMVEDFICGCVTQIGEQGLNIARNALLVGGFPTSIPGVTVNRLEGSSLQAIILAAQVIASGEMDIVLAGGVEFMSRQPMGSDGFGDHISHLGSGVSPRLFERFGALVSQGISAEMMAEKRGFGRQELDDYARRSNELATAAMDSGLYAEEIMPMEVTTPEGKTRMVKYDEGPRRGSSLEEIVFMKPAYKADGIVTTANSGQIADGAAAVLLISEEKCSELRLTPKARYLGSAITAEDPLDMLTGPISATQRLLAKTGLSIDEIDVFEVNESFATVPLAWMKELNPPKPKRINPWGGAIANGNPLGASGAKLTCTLLSELEHMQGRFGLQAMGMGMGVAVIYERFS
jgi:acetyl-CoA acyltransferase